MLSQHAQYRLQRRDKPLVVEVPAPWGGTMEVVSTMEFVPYDNDLTIRWYVNSGIMAAEQQHMLEQAISARRSLIVTGPTGSGKTTLVKTLINEIAEQRPSERMLAVIEDSHGLREHENCTVYVQKDARVGKQMFRSGLRLGVHTFAIDEVRTRPFAQAIHAGWRSGHFVVASVHAVDPLGALLRLQSFAAGDFREAARLRNPLMVHISRRRDGTRSISVTSAADLL